MLENINLGFEVTATMPLPAADIRAGARPRAEAAPTAVTAPRPADAVPDEALATGDVSAPAAPAVTGAMAIRNLGIPRQ